MVNMSPRKDLHPGYVDPADVSIRHELEHLAGDLIQTCRSSACAIIINYFVNTAVGLRFWKDIERALSNIPMQLVCYTESDNS